MSSRSSLAKSVLTVTFAFAFATLLIPAGAEAINVCGNGICEFFGGNGERDSARSRAPSPSRWRGWPTPSA